MSSKLGAVSKGRASPIGFGVLLDGAVEQEFERETDAQRNRQIAFWNVCSLIFIWFSLAFDLLLMPEVWRAALLLRLCIVTPVSLAAIWLHGRPGPQWPRSLSAIASPLVSGMILTILFSISDHPDALRSILVMAVGTLWINVVIPMRPVDALVFTLVTVTSSDLLIFGVLLRSGLPLAYPDIVTSLHILIGLSVLSRVLSERQSRDSFVLGLRLRTRADELARANARLVELTNTDPLTGLANRRSFDVALAQAHHDAAVAGSALAVIMIDIDDFKRFNDTAGHLEGDLCLTAIAQTIAEQVRNGHDLPARFGGEEFVVLMPGAALPEAQEAAGRVHEAVSALKMPHPAHVGSGFVSVCVGVAAARDGRLVPTAAALVAAADAALYAAKRGGRDQVRCNDAFDIAA